MDSSVEGCVSIVVGGSGGGDWDGDACSMPGGSVHLTSGGDILFNTGTPLAGFQMNVDGGATILSAGGGEAEAAGFMVSASGNTVLGFSLTGATIDGCGTLVELELDGSASGLSGIIISDSDGQALPFEYFDGSGDGEDVYGCMDMDACNYDPEATVDSGCEYAEENYDCDGNCTADMDCAGECGGDAVVDECGDCGGDGADVMCEDGSYVCDESDCDNGGGWDGDACSMPSNTVHLTAGGDVLFNTGTPLAGFQMNVDGGATILSAGGGEAEAAGFMISASGNTFLGFSLTGATIDGCGTLVELDLDGNATGLSGIIISDSDGIAIPFENYDGSGGGEDVYGCMDMDACNYNSDATVDEGCDYGSMCWDGSYECDEMDCPDDPGGWDGDACTMPDHSVHVTSSGSVLFNSTTPVAGFQMDLDGATILSAGGGMADEAGFMISSSATTFLGFSLDGSTIDGCGTMVELELDGEASGLSGIIISDSNGELIPFEYFDGSGGGEDPYCGDGECNGDEDATSCPEDCETPSECESDVCLSFMNFNESAGTVNLHMVNTVDVAGFQVELEGSTIASASGGLAEAAGFMISNSESMVLGFSVTGDVIAPTAGNLISLTFDSYNGYTCFAEGTTFSDSGADALTLTLGGCLGDEPIPGCTDSSACNYNSDANVDDGSCWSASAGCECEDGMGSEVDECGVCNGDGIGDGECDCEGNVEDCAGVCGGDAELDPCGVCDGDGSSCDPVSLSFSNVTSNSLDVVMDNPMPVAGFQMELPGININSISGGTSAAADFSISFSGSTLVGFTLSGTDIPAGNAVLFSVGFTAEGDEVCFQDAIVSDENGVGTDLDLGDCADISGGGGSWDGDACTMDDNSVHVAADGSVLYNTLEPVAGFQFSIDGATILNASGGAAEDAGFMISFSETTVLGFSLDGSTFDGCGTMISLELDGTASGMSEIIISNAAGEDIGFTYFDEEIVEEYCGDGECNGDETAESCPEDCDDGGDCEEAWDGDACTMDDNSVHVADDGSVLYNTLEPVAGFQFSIDGATILNASGGAAEDAGFMISFSETTVLGFSLDGSTFDGCGTMISLELDGTASGMSGIIISNAAGEDIGFTYFEGGGDGEPCCGDGECNGDETSESCPEDCGDPEPYCGDGECNGDETSESCPEDCGGGGSWDGDACTMDDNSVHVAADGSVLYNTLEPVAGFQFSIDGATILNASGGAAEDAGFMISFSETTVLGFSLDGSSFDGCGTMINLDLDGTASGMSEIIISNTAGEDIGFTYFDEEISEDYCGDGECNGDETSESCPEDCDEGECPEGYDECGVCDGPGAEYECWDGELVCEASDCSNEPGTDPFNFNQSTMFAYYFVFSAYDCPGDYLVAGEDWIGVYNGDVCVGGAEWPGGPTEVPAFGNDGNEYSEGYLNPGDTPTFKIYDASEDKYYDAMPNENFAFQPYGVNNIIRMDAGLFQNVMLDEGANLVSFYVLPEDNSVEDMMDPLMGNVSAVLSGGSAAQYLDGWGWIGSLTTFEYEAGYWIIMDAAAELNLEGCDSPTANLVYDLQSGANLISYPEQGTSDVGFAIPDDVEDLFEAVLSQGNAAMNTENGWVGSLTSFSGGSGYWVIVSEDLSFSYNLNDGFGRAIEDYSETMPTFGEFKVYQSTEQAFYFVDEITLLDGNVDHGDWLLSYNDNVLTGIRQWQGVVVDIPAMGISDAALTGGYFIEGDVPTFKLLKQSTGELISLDGEIAEWSSNGVFTLSGLSEIESAPGKISLDSAYPNPFNPTTTISFGLPVDCKVSIQIYNLQGRVVETLASQFMQAGYHSVTWNADNFSSGVYFIKMATGDYVSTQKLLLVK